MTNDKKPKTFSLKGLEESVQKQSEKCKTHPVFQSMDEKLRKEVILIENIKKKEKEIVEFYQKMIEPRSMEEAMYRFYHTSFKMFDVQEYVKKGVELLLSLLPECSWNDVNPYFKEIYRLGTYKTFTTEMNPRWTYEARPLLEAYFHVRHFFEMLIKYGIEGTEEMRNGSSGWYTVLYFYKIR